MKNESPVKIKTCLISVSDKRNLLKLAQELESNNIEIISTGGTANFLQQNGIDVISVEDLTGFPEILDGRVKTLHPNIHGGLLARRSNKKHMQKLESLKITPVDMVVINLYPFKDKTRVCFQHEEIIEAIDIGGSTLMRAAAKNYQDITIVSNPDDYGLVSTAIKNNKVLLSLRFSLALKAFDCSARYENEISNYFHRLDTSNSQNMTTKKKFSDSSNLEMPIFSINLKKYSDLRYGENPHQKAAIYCDPAEDETTLVCAQQIQGKRLSYNNLIDADSAFQCAEMLSKPACVIVKHANPCGVAEADSCLEAFKRAKQTDTISSFGSVVAFNEAVDEALANFISRDFIELIIAPDFTKSAKKIFSQKPNIRVIKNPKKASTESSSLEIRSLIGGYLIQNRDTHQRKDIKFTTVTKIKPSEKELADLKFAWIVACWVKSNAIVFCRDSRTLGIGAGQMSRFDSVKIAKMKALQAGQSLENSVVASDAFFPFRDGIDVLSEAGAKSVIQPGGSIKDSEVIAAADEHKIAMLFTGIRHFRH